MSDRCVVAVLMFAHMSGKEKARLPRPKGRDTPGGYPPNLVPASGGGITESRFAIDEESLENFQKTRKRLGFTGGRLRLRETNRRLAKHKDSMLGVRALGHWGLMVALA